MAADTLNGLAAELAAMPAGARRAILNALTTAERAALDRNLAGTPVPDRSDHAPDLSPWLADRIDAARTSPSTITSASRQALLRSIDPAPAAPPERVDAPVIGMAGRSLFGAVGGLLAPRKAR